MNPRTHARILISYHAGSTHPDRRTYLADARIALCLARGVNMDDIDPASGCDYSRRAYAAARASWVWMVKVHGFSDWHGDGERLADELATWTKHRPDFTAGDDWLADGIEAHRVHYAKIGQSCGRQTCDVHPSADYAELLRMIAEDVAGQNDPPASAPGPGVQDSLFDELPLPQPRTARRRPIADLQLPA